MWKLDGHGLSSVIWFLRHINDSVKVVWNTKRQLEAICKQNISTDRFEQVKSGFQLYVQYLDRFSTEDHYHELALEQT